MCAPVALGVASFATGALGAVSQHQSATAQANAANAATSSNYKYQLKMRERNWDRERYRYNDQKLNTENQLYENNLSASKAYASEQVRVNEIFKQAALSNQNQLIQLLGSQGKMSAAGRTGKSAQRVEGSMMSAFGRNQSIQAESLMSATQSYKDRTDRIRRTLRRDNRDAYQQISIAPQPGMSPIRPTMQNGPSPFSLFTGLAGAGLSGFGAYQQYKAPPTAIPNIPVIPTPDLGTSQ